MSVPVHNPAQINEIFDGISYDKARYVILISSNHLFYVLYVVVPSNLLTARDLFAFSRDRQ